MTGDDYWVVISQAGRRLGAGFLLTRCHALTALHCLRSAAPGVDGVEITFVGGETVPGRVYRRSPEADLAVIDIEIPPSVDCPPLLQPDRPAARDLWKNPYRPSLSHALLSGDITHAPAEYAIVGGGTVEAMQLRCAQPVGDYAGYSGSPIQRSEPPERRMLLGILLEQYPDEAAPRATTVLFAATIDEVFRRFDCFGADHLLMGMLPPSATALEPVRPTSRAVQASPATRSADDRIADAFSLIAALDELRKSETLDGIDVKPFKIEVLNKLVSNVMDDSGPA